MYSLSVNKSVMIAALALLAPAAAHAQVRVVTTTPALADITRQVGGEHVEAESLMRGPENVHNVSPKPSFIIKLRRADLFVHLGLDAEPWVPPLLKSTRRQEFLPGGAGNVNAAQGIRLKQVPRRGQLSRALGDIHVYGNTHYLLDPLNGITVARTIAGALAEADPAHAETYAANAEAFGDRLRQLADRLVRQLAPYEGAPIVTYHRAWPYFLDRFGLVTAAEVEPKPGISPGPRHLSAVVETMERDGARVIVVETHSPRRTAEAVAERAGGQAVVLAQEVDALPAVQTYEQLFEYNVGALLAAFKAVGTPTARAAGAAG